MKVFFLQGRNVPNSVLFTEINKVEIELIKSMTRKSRLAKANGFQDKYDEGTYNLTIYLKEDTFENLFKSDNYLEWKKNIIENFPELSEQFPNGENKATNREELRRLQELLPDNNRSPQFFKHYPENIQLLSARLVELEEMEKKLFSEPCTRVDNTI